MRAARRMLVACFFAVCLGGGTRCAAAAVTAPGAAAAGPQVSLIPQPREVAAVGGFFTLSAATSLVAMGGPEAQRCAAYFATMLRRSRGLELKRQTTARGMAAGSILFDLRPGEGGAEEGYRLEVRPQGVVVRAAQPAGLFYGAVTLWQLSTLSNARPILIPALHIDDAPRFRWRGLMLDSVRHFQSPEFIMRYIDWMALHKLNMFGWHLTDDQGWRLQIPKYPRLTTIGAWRVPAGAAAQHDIDPATGRPRLYGGFYSQEDVRRIIAHAAARGVTIVPEIDIPGHATAAIVAYPSLGVQTDPPREVPSDWGVYPNLLNAEGSTFRFLEDVLDEVMALFPGEFIHLGGDEAVKDQWKASERVQVRMRELGVPDEEALQGYFMQRLGRYLQQHGRRMIGWDEILEGGVPPGAAVMSWRGVAGALSAAVAGHDTVLSPEPTLYLDYRQGPGSREPPGRGAHPVTVEDVYRIEPLAGALAGQAPRVLGVQANLWTEHVRLPEQAEYMSWPRAAALAEVAWSPPQLRNWDNFKARLPAQFARYRKLGLHYSNTVLEPTLTPTTYQRHMSQDLLTCTAKLVLNLEDDAPLSGPRAVFLVDIENPCWRMPQVDLGRPLQLTAAVGQVPFNFQIGADRDSIHLQPPHSAAGELNVYADSCEGEPLARLPLAPATANEAVTVLPPVRLAALGGSHDLCLRFAQHGLDPLWVLDWLQLAPQ
ncbi:MAG: family 20 glycosylhydrolase [Proteobacteria bacterium]|nr:family 20 glycosylhydrolase [Pseudomonadota bacterium]